MHTAHIKHNKGMTKADIVKKLKGYNTAFRYLEEILLTQKKEPAVRDYDVPSWELRQISVNEYNQAIDDLMKLLTIKE